MYMYTNICTYVCICLHLRVRVRGIDCVFIQVYKAMYVCIRVYISVFLHALMSD